MSTVVLEKNTRFSQSLLWQYQRDYFKQQGINAWAGQVPFYITSNPFIGHAYAEIIINYLQDLSAKNALAFDKPIIVLELGTGSGRFSYYCMKHLFELQENLGLQHLKIQYVMSDFTDNNQQFWLSHEALQPYFQNGKLDTAIFNLEEDQSIKLTQSGFLLTANSLENPLIVIGNYIFDTICHDAFRVEDYKLSELHTHLETDSSNLQNEQPKALDKIKTTFQPKPVNADNYYDDPVYNSILKSYEKQFQNTSFLFPLGGLNALKTLASWSNQRLLVISTDKSYSTTEELNHRYDPSVTFHGSFSMMVNFHAMGEFFKKSQGDAFQQSLRRITKTSAFVMGASFKELPQTHRALQNYLEGFSPGDFFNLHEHVKKTAKEADLKVLVSHLYLSHWDPHIYNYMADRISKEIGDTGTDDIVRQSLKAGMPKILANIYWMPGAHNSFFDIASLFHAIKDYNQALECYHKAVKHFGGSLAIYHNMALCYYFQGDEKQALDYFKKAIAYDANSTVTREWIEKLEKKQT